MPGAVQSVLLAIPNLNLKTTYGIALLLPPSINEEIEV